MIYEEGTVIKENFGNSIYWEVILDRESAVENGEQYSRYTLKRWSEDGSVVYTADTFTVERIHNWINGSATEVIEDEEEMPDFVVEERESLDN